MWAFGRQGGGSGLQRAELRDCEFSVAPIKEMFYLMNLFLRLKYNFDEQQPL